MLPLDRVAWADGVRVLLAESIAALERFMADHAAVVVEGCYGDLAEAAAARRTELRPLNPGPAVCLADARSRPWEPDYCTSPEWQAELLAGPLTAFALNYEHAADAYGLARHRAMFAARPGPKREGTR